MPSSTSRHYSIDARLVSPRPDVGVNPRLFSKLTIALRLDNPNKGEKIADSGVVADVGGTTTVYPSIQVEVVLSDSVLENRRDCSLWVTSTNLEVRILFILNRLIALGKISRWA